MQETEQEIAEKAHKVAMKFAKITDEEKVTPNVLLTAHSMCLADAIAMAHIIWPDVDVEKATMQVCHGLMQMVNEAISDKKAMMDAMDAALDKMNAEKKGK